MKVSVIIPTYKPENYLFDCLNSLVNQTVDHGIVEVLLILNGPKDPYFKKIERFIGQFDNINIYLSYCSIAHVSAARNQGLQLAKGEYVIFIDDDDMVSSSYIQGLLEEATPTGIVCSNVLSFNRQVRDSEKINLSHTYDRNRKNEPSRMSLRSHLSLVWGKLIPFNLISESQFDIRFKNGEDALFMALISSKIVDYRLAKESVIYFWRMRFDSASKKRNSIFYETKNAILLMLAFLKIYWSAPFEYSFLFFMTRVFAVIKRLLYRLPKSRL